MAQFATSPLWSQHFFRDPARGAAVIAQLPLAADALVYEIGPGTGILTAALARRVKHVVAVEIDPALCARLRARCAAWPNVRVVHADFLHYPLPSRDYTIVSNVPFGVTAAVIAKLLRAPYPPRAAYLVLQAEAAERFAGVPRETQYSVLTKPWFTFAIEEHFARTEFVPVPRVDAALLAIRRRDPPLIGHKDATRYRAFVQYGFGRWRKDLKTSFRGIFSNLQFKTLARTLQFPLDATPTQLTFDQWFGLFRFFQTGVPLHKQQALVARVREMTGPVIPHRGAPITLPLPRPPPLQAIRSSAHIGWL
jgi:23S rRNA (adenine-N6)-dimethyltransferase